MCKSWSFLTHQEAHGQLVGQHLCREQPMIFNTEHDRVANSCRSEQIALDKDANFYGN